MRWRGADGTKWRVRQRRLAWTAKVPFGDAVDAMPHGLGDDPISFVIGLPGLVLFLIVLALWLAEFALRLLLAPVAMVLRLARVVPYRLELIRGGRHVDTYEPVGLPALWRERRRLAAGDAYRG